MRNSTNVEKSKGVYKSGNTNMKSSSRPIQDNISPIKQISDPKYVANLGESMDSDLSIRNDDKAKMQVAQLRSQLEEQEEEDESISDLVVHKYKKPENPNYYSQQRDADKPKDFSVTENYFSKEQAAKTVNQFSSPKSPQTFKS